MKIGWHIAMFLPVPVVTVLVMWWDRTVHDVASSPQPWERVLANVVWYGSLAALAALPVLVSLRWKAAPSSRPVILALILGVAAGLYLIGVLGWNWPRWPELFNSDLEVVGGTYLAGAVAFSLALNEAIRSYRSGMRSLAAGGGLVALFCGCVALVSSYLLVFFE